MSAHGKHHGPLDDEDHTWHYNIERHEWFVFSILAIALAAYFLRG